MVSVRVRFSRPQQIAHCITCALPPRPTTVSRRRAHSVHDGLSFSLVFSFAALPALLAIPMFDDDLRTGIVLGTVMAQPWEEGGDAEETLHELFLVAP